MPLVSIVMPTYNRADTIERAIGSVQAQTFTDWELIVVDDGSTDDTVARIAGLEPRMRLIRQENRGFVGARNTGLSASTGRYLAFLDSDDEWLAHHLELAVAFLEAFPDEQFVVSELAEDFGQGRIVNHYRIETSEWYPAIARQLQSPGLDRRPGSDDDYLRVYDSREPIGDWGSEILKRAGIDEEKFVYSGDIYEKLRWGFLLAVNSLVIRKTAIEIVGLQNPTYNLAADYHYMGLLCRNFRANFLGLPTYVKHELTSSGELPASSHIATGTTSFIFGQDMLRSFDNLFWNERKDDPELSALRGIHLFGLAQAAVRHGERDAALRYLKEARRSGKGHYRMFALEGFVRCLPHAALTRMVYTNLNKGTYAGKQLLRGELSPLFLLRKMLGQVSLRSLYNNRALLFFLISYLYPVVSLLLSDELVAASAAASDLSG